MRDARLSPNCKFDSVDVLYLGVLDIDVDVKVVVVGPMCVGGEARVSRGEGRRVLRIGREGR